MNNDSLTKNSMNPRGYEALIEDLVTEANKQETTCQCLRVRLKVNKTNAKLIDDAIKAQCTVANHMLTMLADEVKRDYAYFPVHYYIDPVTEEPARTESGKLMSTEEYLHAYDFEPIKDVFRTNSIGYRNTASDYVRYSRAYPEDNFIRFEGVKMMKDDNGNDVLDKYGNPVPLLRSGSIYLGNYATAIKLGTNKKIQTEFVKFYDEYTKAYRRYKFQLSKYDKNKESMSEEDFANYEKYLARLKEDAANLQPAQFTSNTLYTGANSYNCVFANYERDVKIENGGEIMFTSCKEPIVSTDDDGNEITTYKERLYEISIPSFIEKKYANEHGISTNLTLRAYATDDFFYETMKKITKVGKDDNHLKNGTDHIGEVTITKFKHPKHGNGYYLNVPVIYAKKPYNKEELLESSKRENVHVPEGAKYIIAGLDLGINQQATLAIDYYDENGNMCAEPYKRFFGIGAKYVRKMKWFERKYAELNLKKATTNRTQWSDWITTFCRNLIAEVVGELVRKGVQVVCMENLDSLDRKRRRERINNYDALVGKELHDANMQIHKQRLTSKSIGTFPYGKLQAFLKSACDRVGILVQTVDPKYTSQTCPFCGSTYVEKWIDTGIPAYRKNGEPLLDKNGNAVTQKKLVYVEECPVCHNRLHHDHKGAINIARSFKMQVDLVGNMNDLKAKKSVREMLGSMHPVVSTIKKNNKLCANDDMPVYTLNKSGKSFDVEYKRSEFSKQGFTILGRKESMPQFIEDYAVEGYNFLGWRIAGEDKIYLPLEGFSVNKMFTKIEAVWEKVPKSKSKQVKTVEEPVAEMATAN